MVAISPYSNNINSDDGNIYSGLPGKVVLPTQPQAYFSMPWLPHYTPQAVADIVYGNPSLFWLILVANNIVNPYSITVGQEISILLPEYVNLIKVQ